MVCGLALRCSISCPVKYACTKVQKFVLVFISSGLLPPAASAEGGELQLQFWQIVAGEIPVGVPLTPAMDVAQIRLASSGRCTRDIHVGSIPVQKRLDGKTMSQVVKPDAMVSARITQPDPT